MWYSHRLTRYSLHFKRAASWSLYISKAFTLVVLTAFYGHTFLSYAETSQLNSDGRFHHFRSIALYFLNSEPPTCQFPATIQRQQPRLCYHHCSLNPLYANVIPNTMWNISPTANVPAAIRRDNNAARRADVRALLLTEIAAMAFVIP